MSQQWDQGRNKNVSGNKWTHNNPKPRAHSEGNPERDVHNNTGLHKEGKKISNKQLNPALTRTKRKTTNNSQNKYKEGNKSRSGQN